MLNNKSILITGGTGSFGKAFIKTVLERYPDIKRVIIFSRDELKQFEMSQTFSENKYTALRYFLGDVRDKDRVLRAFENVDYVIHAAALKQVVAAEFNPFEFIKTNIIGAQNIVEAAFDTNVKKIVALSTDKAAAPVNLYGATKLCSDKLFTAASNMRGDRDLKISVVRYGNVMGSRGSVIPFFMKEREKGVIPITDASMTRFNISLSDSVEMVLWSLQSSLGGEVLIPKIPSYRITDLAEAIAPECEQKLVGIRPGEKLHEEMITVSDSLNTVDIGDYYAILPSMSNVYSPAEYCQHFNGCYVDKNFSYDSGTNEHFLNIEELKKLIKQHVS